MATDIERVQAICNALINKVATNGQIDRVGKGLAAQAGKLVEYTEATAAGKARIFLVCSREFYINCVKSNEVNIATSAAALTAVANTDIDFAEIP